jgi:DNA-directed RNA polymerase subunit RPC12/RpoP
MNGVRVIKVGKIPQEPMWRGHCRNCNSEIEAPRQALDPVHMPAPGCEHGYLDCPVCGERRGVQLRPET